MPGAGVRISREQQAEIDAEIGIHLGAISKRGRKRRTIALPSDDEEEVQFVLPQSIRLSAAMMRRFIASHNEEAMARWSKNEAVMRIERLEEMWRDFNAEWKSLAGVSLSDAKLSACNEFFGEITDEYLMFKVKLHDGLEQVSKFFNNGMVQGQSSTAMAVGPGGQVIQIQLAEPPKVPKFSGLEVDWANFRAVFEVEVHVNPRFTNKQKMHFLLDSLQGRAAKAYANWPIVNDNSYELLWAEICKQYGNEYNTIRAHLQALQGLKSMQQPTSEAMRQIIDVARGSFRQLQLLLQPQQIAEYMLLHQLESLLDTEGRMQWNLRRTADALPTLTQMFNFMQLRASMLETPIEVSSTAVITETRRSTVANGTNVAARRGLSVGRVDESYPACDLCSGETHWPFKCPRFRAKSITERLNYVTTHRMCTNCFSLKHYSKMCPDKGCPRCNKKHNSCLCPFNSNVDGQAGSQERMQRLAEPRQSEGVRVGTANQSLKQ